MNRLSSKYCQTVLSATPIDTFVGPAFNAKEKDYESGYHYYGARYYDSELLTGWLSVDSETDELPHLTAYNYCNDNPVILNDPDGEFPVWAVVGSAIDYGLQVYDNYSQGKTGVDAWTDINVVSVVGSAVNPLSKVKAVTTAAKMAKVAGEVAYEAFPNVVEFNVGENHPLNIETDVKKVATKTAAKKAAATATSTKGVSVVAATGRAVSKTANGDGSFVENLVAEAVGYGAAKGVTKAVNKAIKPKLTTNDAALANKGKGEKGSTVIRNNRSTNQTNLDKSNRNRSIATNVGTTATSWGTAAAQSAVKKDPNCNK